MKRLMSVRLIKREDAKATNEFREPTILDHGDPITVKLTRELEDRRRRMNLTDSHPAGL